MEFNAAKALIKVSSLIWDSQPGISSKIRHWVEFNIYLFATVLSLFCALSFLCALSEAVVVVGNHTITLPMKATAPVLGREKDFAPNQCLDLNSGFDPCLI